MSTTTTTAPKCIDITVRAELDGWPVDIALSLPAAQVAEALRRLAEHGYRPRVERAAPAAGRTSGPGAEVASPPTCPAHGPSKVRPGQRGGFYCAAKLPDGSYCRERPI